MNFDFGHFKIILITFVLGVYTYVKTGTGSWTFANKLLPGEGCGGNFGNYIAVSEDALQMMITSYCSASVYYYTKPSSTGAWGLVQTLSVTGQFGVAMCGNVAFVGAAYYDITTGNDEGILF